MKTNSVYRQGKIKGKIKYWKKQKGNKKKREKITNLFLRGC